MSARFSVHPPIDFSHKDSVKLTTFARTPEQSNYCVNSVELMMSESTYCPARVYVWFWIESMLV